MKGRLLEDVTLIRISLGKRTMLSRIAKKGERVTVGFYSERSYFLEGNRLYTVIADDGFFGDVDCSAVELTF